MNTPNIIIFLLTLILEIKGNIHNKVYNDKGILGFFERECDGDWRVYTELRSNLVLGANPDS